MNKRLFSLWEIMNHFCALQIAYLLEQVSLQRSCLEQLKSQSGGGQIPDSSQILLFAGLVNTAINLCFAAMFGEALGRIQRIHVPKADADKQQDISTMLASLKIINDSIYEEMSKRHFLTVSEDRVGYLENLPQIFPFENTYQDHTFWGNEGAIKFRSAARDIRDAGNCLAAECHTAAVFHGMRVAEHGIRILAKRLKVVITHKGKPEPIEFATWEKVVDSIKSQLTKAHSLPRSAKRQNKLSYYSDLADRCTYMKDLWRNEVMHTRLSFNRLEAAGILQRVREFMQLLEKKEQ